MEKPLKTEATRNWVNDLKNGVRQVIMEKTMIAATNWTIWKNRSRFGKRLGNAKSAVWTRFRRLTYTDDAQSFQTSS